MDSEIILFDYNHFFTSKLSGVALDIYLKVPKLEQGKVFKYKNSINDDINQKLIMTYFNRKLENHKLQDRKGKKRQISKKGYVNAEWFLKNTNNSCNYIQVWFPDRYL